MSDHRHHEISLACRLAIARSSLGSFPARCCPATVVWVAPALLSRLAGELHCTESALSFAVFFIQVGEHTLGLTAVPLASVPALPPAVATSEVDLLLPLWTAALWPALLDTPGSLPHPETAATPLLLTELPLAACLLSVVPLAAPVTTTPLALEVIPLATPAQLAQLPRGEHSQALAMTTARMLRFLRVPCRSRPFVFLVAVPFLGSALVLALRPRFLAAEPSPAMTTARLSRELADWHWQPPQPLLGMNTGPLPVSPPASLRFCGYSSQVAVITRYLDTFLAASASTAPPLLVAAPLPGDIFPALAIAGPAGIGKSCLLRELAANYPATAHLLDLQAFVTSCGADIDAEPTLLSTHLLELPCAPDRPLLLLLDHVDAIVPLPALSAALLREIQHLRTRVSRLLTLIATSSLPLVRNSVLGKTLVGFTIAFPLPDAATRLAVAAQLFDPPDPAAAAQLANVTPGFPGRDLQRLLLRARALQIPLVEARQFLDGWYDVPSAAIAVERPLGDWRAIGGLDDVRAALDQAIGYPLLYPAACQRIMGRSAARNGCRGVVLHGPSGVGKSLCAEAFAATLWPRVNFIRVKTPLLLSKYFGGSEESIRQLFRLARQLTPALVFLDELDAISASRGLDEGDASSGLNERIVATLLNELDGIGHQDAAEATVFLVACTNRLAAVDPALLRPGRFGTHIHVGLPNPAQRLDILRTLAQSIAFDPTPECLDLLGPRTAGFTGADLALLCQEAALLALADDPDVARIPLSCFQRALGGFASQSQSQAL